jgi:TRAP-type transport system periplasmic protein
VRRKICDYSFKFKEDLLMKILTVIFSLLLVIAFLAGACSQQAPTTSAPATSKPASSAPASSVPAPAAGVKTLKFAYDMPPTGAIVAGWTYFATQLNQQTNGAYKIDFFPAQTLIKQAVQLDALQQGVADMTDVQLTSQQQAFPINTVVSLPSVAFPDTVAGQLASRQADRDLYDKFPAIANEFKNFHLLFRHPLPAYIIVTKNKKIALPNDLKGLKIGCEGINKDILSSAGASPVNMVPPDMYDNLSKGVVDGAMVGWFHMVSQHFYEVVNYYLEYPFVQQPQTVLMNTNSWNNLPPDVQKIIVDLTPKVEATSTDSYMSQIQQGHDLVAKANGVVTVPTADQKALWATLNTSLDQIWLNDMKSRGVTDAQAILDFMHQRAAQAWAANK